MSTDDWRHQAACLGHNPEIWFPIGDGEHREFLPVALGYCQPCPVRTACLSWAMDTDQRYGVWGGMTEGQRDNLRRRDRRRAAR